MKRSSNIDARGFNCCSGFLSIFLRAQSPSARRRPLCKCLKRNDGARKRVIVLREIRENCDFRRLFTDFIAIVEMAPTSPMHASLCVVTSLQFTRNGKLYSTRHASNRSVTASTYCICANDSGNLSTGLYVVSRRDENEQIVVNSGHSHCFLFPMQTLPSGGVYSKKAAKR
jgi:hypothetical protein